MYASVIDEHRRELCADPFKPAAKVRRALVAPLDAHNPIIALCGRMLAALPETNVDGALQVAHAFTTHSATLELDYFTAVDDQVQLDDEETGAGHINVGEYTSGVFYRHATIGLLQLAELLDGSEAAAAEAAASFIRAFVLAEPTGKQNSANAHTRPDLVAVTVRSDRPVSFASAFEMPAEKGRAGGYLHASARRLDDRASDENEMYGSGALLGAWHMHTAAAGDEFGGLGARVRSLDELISAAENATADAVAAAGGAA